MDLAVYVLVRTDLPSLNPGKAMSQCHHAAVQMMAQHADKDIVQTYLQQGDEGGADGFNTTIVLGADLHQIMKTNLTADAGRYLHDTVIDPSYPFIVPSQEIADLIPQDDAIKTVKVLDDGRVLMVRPETTVSWYLGDRNDNEFRSMFDDLNLYP